MTGKRKVISAGRSFSNLTEKSPTRQTNNLTKQSSIPVLTDITLLPEEKRISDQDKTSSQSTLLSDEHLWNELEERLNRRIHKQITERINFVLDENLEQHVSTILEQVLTLLVNEIKHDMQKTLEVMITHAVSTELQHLKTEQMMKDNPFFSDK